MLYLRKILFYTTFCILSLILLIGMYILSAYLFSRLPVQREESTASDVSIYILTNGVHTDLVLPLKNDQADWSKDILFTNTISKDSLADWIALGWGDKGFYLNTPTWADLTFSTAFKAAFSLSTSAIHATFYKKMKEGNDCRRIELSREQYSRLVKYIRNSFMTSNGGRFMNIRTNANYNDHDAFYEATGSYSLFHTCNTWANNGLKSCGQKACWWTPFDTGIFYQYK